MAEITQVVACKAIIIRDGKVLLLRESPAHITNTQAGRYQFPGGRIEPGEHFLDGLRREVREETGLEIEPEKPFYVGEWFPKVHDKQLHIVGIFFTCTDKGGEVVISEEHDNFKWVGLSDVDAINIMHPDSLVVQNLLPNLR